MQAGDPHWKSFGAEKMEKSNKTINAGVDTRTVLSAIAQHFSPEEMVGNQVTLIANLAPRKMMAIESQGMVLMVEDGDGKLKLIQASDLVSPVPLLVKFNQRASLRITFDA